MNNLSIFEEDICYKFKNIKLLKTALTHTSYAHDNKIESNEKLEFLGDSILEFVVSNYLYENYKRLREGEMTKVRATVVCEKSLYQVAQKHNFRDFLYLGKSEEYCNGREKPAILADSVEAVIAAIYMDSDLNYASDFIINNLKDSIEVATKNVGEKDYKTVLQEKLQIHGNVDIKYNVIEEKGPDHNKIFVVEVTLNGTRLSTGKGPTKKSAEMQAASKALQTIS